MKQTMGRNGEFVLIPTVRHRVSAQSTSLGKILLSCAIHRPWIRLDGHSFHIAPRPTKPLSECSQLEACPAIASRPRPLFRYPWKGGRQRAKAAMQLCSNTIDYSVKIFSFYFASCRQCSHRQSRATSERLRDAPSWKRSELSLLWRCNFYLYTRHSRGFRKCDFVTHDMKKPWIQSTAFGTLGAFCRSLPEHIEPDLCADVHILTAPLFYLPRTTIGRMLQGEGQLELFLAKKREKRSISK